jgi:hypothetical protein
MGTLASDTEKKRLKKRCPAKAGKSIYPPWLTTESLSDRQAIGLSLAVMESCHNSIQEEHFSGDLAGPSPHKASMALPDRLKKTSGPCRTENTDHRKNTGDGQSSEKGTDWL